MKKKIKFRNNDKFNEPTPIKRVSEEDSKKRKKFLSLLKSEEYLKLRGCY